jgi:uncharacterized protein YqeY
MASDLKSRITAATKEAMRAGEKQRLAALRYISAAIIQREVDKRVDLDDEAVLAVLTKLAKQRRESIEQFQQAGRQDLADKESAELAVLQLFLPAQIDAAELAVLIESAISASGASSQRDMGKVMGMLKDKIAGRADMGEVSKAVKERLSS